MENGEDEGGGGSGGPNQPPLNLRNQIVQDKCMNIDKLNQNPLSAVFKSMVNDYGIPLEVDHVTCMIDTFGRSGHLAEAKELATSYNGSWEALLGACSTHWQTELGREVSNVLKMAEPSEEMSFVLLSNLYCSCSSGRWKEAEDVRREMAERGMKKTPGCSWIEVGNQVSAFVVGDCTSH
uniref:DYW domain-containing protein n=1 Tax=Brassica campestris TaxID=3711 RepID=M4CLY9_BRACM